MKITIEGTPRITIEGTADECADAVRRLTPQEQQVTLPVDLLRRLSEPQAVPFPFVPYEPPYPGPQVVPWNPGPTIWWGNGTTSDRVHIGVSSGSLS